MTSSLPVRKAKAAPVPIVDSFLREHARRNGVARKIGLYTSPSPWSRNRICIDSNPIYMRDSLYSASWRCSGASLLTRIRRLPIPTLSDSSR